MSNPVPEGAFAAGPPAVVPDVSSIESSEVQIQSHGWRNVIHLLLAAGALAGMYISFDAGKSVEGNKRDEENRARIGKHNGLVKDVVQFRDADLFRRLGALDALEKIATIEVGMNAHNPELQAKADEVRKAAKRSKEILSKK